ALLSQEFILDRHPGDERLHGADGAERSTTVVDRPPGHQCGVPMLVEGDRDLAGLQKLTPRGSIVERDGMAAPPHEARHHVVHLDASVVDEARAEQCCGLRYGALSSCVGAKGGDDNLIASDSARDVQEVALHGG